MIDWGGDVNHLNNRHENLFMLLAQKTMDQPFLDQIAIHTQEFNLIDKKGDTLLSKQISKHRVKNNFPEWNKLDFVHYLIVL